MTEATDPIPADVRRNLANPLWRMLTGRASCCGATNDHCGRYADPVRWPHTGCDNCGHSRGCHAW